MKKLFICLVIVFLLTLSFVISTPTLWLGNKYSSADLIGYWKFNEAADNVFYNATDSSDYGQTGNNTNTTFTSGKLGNAANINNTGLYFDMGKNLYGLNESFTISGWINITNDLVGTHNYIISKSDSAGNFGTWFLRLNTGKWIEFHAVDTVSDINCNVKNTTFWFNDSEWHSFVVTRNMSDIGSMRLYIDGMLSNVTDCPASYNFSNKNSPEADLRIGRTQDGGDSRMEIDDVQLWNISWVQEDITTNAEGREADYFTLFTNSSTYNATTWETSRENFVVNISYNPNYTSVSARLFYNGTYYTSTETTDEGGYIVFENTLDIPTELGNKEFFWNFTFVNASETIYDLSDSYNQTINLLNMSACESDLSNMSYNFTAYEEANLTWLSTYDFAATLDYWLGNGTYKKNLSIDSDDNPENIICINTGDKIYKVDGLIEYAKSGYGTRNYFFDGNINTANNITQNISLILLNDSDSTSFILHVQNQNQQNVEDAFIHTQRYYPGIGDYKTVQIAKTDSDGKSAGFFKTETVDYRFIVVLNGIIELTTSKRKVIPEDTPYTILLTIGAALDSPWADFDDLANLIYTLIFNSTTNITTLEYTDNSDSFTEARLLVIEKTHNETDKVICNTTSSDISAIIECDASGYSGTFEAHAFIRRTTEKTISIINFIITTARDIFDKTGLLLGWFIILTAGFIMIWHPIAGILSIDAAIIFVNLIGFISFSPLFIFAIIAISIILIFIIKD